jgi:hypothetical protein
MLRRRGVGSRGMMGGARSDGSSGRGRMNREIGLRGQRGFSLVSSVGDMMMRSWIGNMSLGDRLARGFDCGKTRSAGEGRARPSEERELGRSER